MTLTRLTGEGLSLNEAYQALDLSRAVGRRLVSLSATDHGDTSTTRPAGRATEGNR